MQPKNLEEQIRRFLPGTDCAGRGGCGFPTCLACAAAIAAGAPANQCPACGEEAVAAIVALTGGEPVSAKHQRAFVKCDGHAAGRERFKGKASCEEAVRCGFSEGECRYGCVGAGSCAAVCTFHALSMEDGAVRLHLEQCNGCGACVSACPQKLIHMIPDDATHWIPCSNRDAEEKTLSLCGWGCIGCGDCAEACPENAITVEENCASIDYDKCVGCIACAVACRKKVIHDTYHDITKLKESVAFVRCRGGYHNHQVYALTGAKTCREAVEHPSGNHCHYGCAGFGDCAKVCRFDAMEEENSTAKVNPDRCVGCGDCVRECPQQLPVLVPYKGTKLVPCASRDAPALRKTLCWVCCIGCGDCADNCPDGVIHLEDGRAVIASEACEDCTICTYVCPRGVITGREIPEYTYLQIRAMAAGRKGGGAQ